MKITRIEVANVAAIARAEINLPTGALLVGGDNMAGKTSLRDAISMALVGQPARVSKKNQLGQMVHDGAKKGRASVFLADTHGVTENTYTLPKGEFSGIEMKGAEYLPLLIDPSKFAAMSADERKTTLFKITGCSASMKTIQPLLEKRSVDMARFAEVQPMLRSGFSAAEKYAQDKAREGKGAWKAVTGGETWGSDKGEGWEPEEVATANINQADIDAAAKELADLNADLEEAQQTLGQRKAERDAAAQRGQRIAELEEVAGLLERRKAKLAVDEKSRDEWTAKLEEARRAADGGPVFDPLCCPHCQMPVKLDGKDLVPAVDLGHVADPDAAKRVTEFDGYLQGALRAVANSKRDVQASTDAAAALAELKQAQAGASSDEALANAEETINTLRQQRDTAKAKHAALADAASAAAGRKETIENAAAWHADIMAWLAIAEAMSPEGIPAELLQSALAPVNQSLANMANMAGWPLVQISNDIELTSKGRPYSLNSESEQWRADTLVALAIAQITGLRLAVLDRFDVLAPKARGQLIGLVRDLVAMDCMDTIIMLGTLKEKPATLPAEFTAAWISNNIVEA